MSEERPDAGVPPGAASAAAGPGARPDLDDPLRPVNISQHLPAQAARFPFKPAVVFPEGRDAKGRVSYTHLTFRQLDDETSRLARGFEKHGVGLGTRVLVMLTPSLEFIAVTFALFRVGAVPILIDPGMGRRHLLDCISGVEPEAFVGVPLAQGLAAVFRRAFRSVKLKVTVGRRLGWGGVTLDELRHPDARPYDPAPTRSEDQAAVLFTTGSTGPPKGVVYTHGIFDAQVHMIRDHYGITPEDVDLPGFPLFALFSTAWGMTCVIPDMDPRRPAEVDPVKMIEAVENFGVTTSFGSPAIWNRVSAHCLEHGIRLPSIKRILMAGAPVPGWLVERFPRILVDGDIHTPYGATECLPTASISGQEIRGETGARTREGAGVCVGRALPGNTLRIVGIDEGEIPEWDEGRVLPPGEIGEIVVRGPVVTPGYQGKPEATRMAKIADGDRLRHRMGDVGYLDEEGRLWFCGRKAHRVVTPSRTYYSIPCEAIFNEHPEIFRSALVGLGDRPAIVVEPHPESFPECRQDRDRLRGELLKRGQENALTRSIDTVLFHRSFPVDIRHNAKIFREQLSEWAREVAR